VLAGEDIRGVIANRVALCGLDSEVNLPTPDVGAAVRRVKALPSPVFRAPGALVVERN
jgi:hypothetical protein